MTDEQITIDGCNVNKCVYYCDAKGKCKSARIMVDFDYCHQCDDDPNCYYKNWQRKEQLLEKVKLMLQTIIETNKVYPLQNNLLKLLDIIEGKENE